MAETGPFCLLLWQQPSDNSYLNVNAVPDFEYFRNKLKSKWKFIKICSIFSRFYPRGTLRKILILQNNICINCSCSQTLLWICAYTLVKCYWVNYISVKYTNPMCIYFESISEKKRAAIRNYLFIFYAPPDGCTRKTEMQAFNSIFAGTIYIHNGPELKYKKKN